MPQGQERVGLQLIRRVFLAKCIGPGLLAAAYHRNQCESGILPFVHGEIRLSWALRCLESCHISHFAEIKMHMAVSPDSRAFLCTSYKLAKIVWFGSHGSIGLVQVCLTRGSGPCIKWLHRYRGITINEPIRHGYFPPFCRV